MVSSGISGLIKEETRSQDRVTHQQFRDTIGERREPSQGTAQSQPHEAVTLRKMRARGILGGGELGRVLPI